MHRLASDGGFPDLPVPEMTTPELVLFPDATALCEGVAARWLDDVAAAARAGELYRVALPGGRIAKTFMECAAKTAREARLPFGHVEFFWGDERCVPPDHADSNFLLASDALLRPLGIAGSRIHRMRGELDPAKAAEIAEAELRSVCPSAPDGQPRLDLVILGMGEDAHVASLFPGAPSSVTAATGTCIPVIGPKPPPQRITLTFPAIRAAKAVWVLVTGQAKEEALHRSLAPGASTPLGRVLAERPVTLFCADLRLP